MRLRLNLDELVALDDVLDALISLQTHSVLIDWHFRGIRYDPLISLHERVMKRIESEFHDEHMQINEREGFIRMTNIQN